MSSHRATLDGLRIDRGAAPARKSAGWLIPVLVIVVVLGGVAIWWSTRSPAVEVRTAVARVQGTTGERTLLNASGYVTARREATVSSKVTGKVLEAHVEEGMEVETGQVLARLDSSNVEASLSLAQAQLERARKSMEETKPNLDFARQEQKRFTDLAATKIVSESDLRRAQMEAKSLEARLARQEAEIGVAESEVGQWKQQLDDTIIRAPFSGIVTSKNAQPGEMISPMSVGGFTRTGICTIVDMNSLEVEVDVSESYINRVQPEQPVEAILDAYPDWRIPAKVIAIIPTADRQKATVKVRVAFAKLDPRILPHMGVKVAFQGAKADGGKPVGNVVVPKTAVQQADGRDVVWVARGNQVERRAVTVAAAIGDETVLSAGLSGGEKVVVSAPEGLHDGARVIEKTP